MLIINDKQLLFWMSQNFLVIQNQFFPAGIITCPANGIQCDMFRFLPDGLMSCCYPSYKRA